MDVEKYSSDSVPCLVNSKMSSSWLVWPLKEPKNHAGREACFLESSTHLGCVYIAVYRIVSMLLRRVAIYNGSISPKSQCQILHILIHHYYISYSHILAKGFFFKFNVTWDFLLPCTICDNILRNISIQNVLLLHCAFFEGLYYMLNKSL